MIEKRVVLGIRQNHSVSSAISAPTWLTPTSGFLFVFQGLAPDLMIYLLTRLACGAPIWCKQVKKTRGLNRGLSYRGFDQVLQAVVHIEFDWVSCHTETCDFVHLQCNECINQVI